MSISTVCKVLSLNSDEILNDIVAFAKMQSIVNVGNEFSFVWNPCGLNEKKTVFIEERYVCIYKTHFLRKKKEWSLCEYSKKHSLTSNYDSFVRELNFVIMHLPIGLEASVIENVYDQRISTPPVELGSEARKITTCTLSVSVSAQFSQKCFKDVMEETIVHEPMMDSKILHEAKKFKDRLVLEHFEQLLFWEEKIHWPMEMWYVTFDKLRVGGFEEGWDYLFVQQNIKLLNSISEVYGLAWAIIDTYKKVSHSTNHIFKMHISGDTVHCSEFIF